MKEKAKSYRPMTRFSEEQVIIAQLQGSTESSSQLLRTPWGSFRSLFMAIKASTAYDREEKNVRHQKIASRKRN